MRRHNRPERPAATFGEQEASLAERLHAERERLFKASSIVECCRLACASKLVSADPERLNYALHAAWDLIVDAAESLEGIGEALEDSKVEDG